MRSKGSILLTGVANEKRRTYPFFLPMLLHYFMFNNMLLYIFFVHPLKYIAISKVTFITPPHFAYLTPLFFLTLVETNLYSVNAIPVSKQHVSAPGELTLILVSLYVHPHQDYWACTDTPGDSVQLLNTLRGCRVVCGGSGSACVLDLEVL